MGVRQQVGHHHRPHRHPGAVAGGATDAQEIVVGHAVVEVDLALEAAFAQRARRHRRRRAGGAHHHGVGGGADQFQRLRHRRGVGGREAFLADDLDAVLPGGLFHFHPESLAQGVVEADEGQLPDAVGGGVAGDALGHQGIGMWRLEDPAALVVHRIDQARRRGQRDNRGGAAGHGVQHGHGIGGGGGADDEVGLVFRDQLVRIADRAGGVGGVVQHHVFDLDAADLGGQQADGVAFGNAQRGLGAGGGQGGADLHLRQRGRGARHQQGRQRGRQSATRGHAVSPLGRGYRYASCRSATAWKALYDGIPQVRQE